ncbi:hypothetical protein SC1_04256 [Sphingopyxis sp. C-1]|nr:hypothetical protein SC1_04256 [Sphingopyxis sp. C-1]
MPARHNVFRAGLIVRPVEKGDVGHAMDRDNSCPPELLQYD